MRHGDDQWRDIVDFCVLALMPRKTWITLQNVDEMLKSTSPQVNGSRSDAGHGKASAR